MSYVLEAATLVLLVRELMVEVLEAARDVIRRRLDERHHILRPVRGEAVAHVLRVRALLRTERLGERCRDGAQLCPPRLQHGEGVAHVAHELSPLRVGAAVLEALGHRHKVGVEPGPCPSDVAEVDVREDISLRPAQQHVVLVAIAQPKHKARGQGANRRVVQPARVGKVCAKDGDSVLECLDVSRARSGGDDAVRVAAAAGARRPPQLVSLLEQ
mmetsp:Transcript_62690/g.151214  ORF Transcript_62690/g.151214 Transcript_62690/m.151214 type:complete len:215 (-) Transcript_62690:202-846(-)